MTIELEKDLRQITRAIYCNIGEKKLDQLIELIKPFCMERESKEIIKIVENEKKLIDERFEKINECIISEKEFRRVLERIK